MQKIKVDLEMGSNLRILRKKHQYTQDRLVAKLDGAGIVVTRGVYSRYETGELNIPVSVIVALKRIYNCSYEDFFTGL